ncbi:hypothetical protein Rhe02_64370 [Rhizocola hellebori]|uniref:Septum formation-related domain-containing protein n=1 Tax=Rhizocola hellebori TaxID=1392758 RepID=A0A8J3QCZ5_9ACTN|nr:hypothetical protein Rhe02_64370 [Rhizocola hellebori]
MLGVGLSLAILSGGCDLTRASLTDEWPQMPAVQAFAPQAEVCHAAVAASVDSRSYRPVDCAQKHLVQTVHVGQLTGDVATLAAPPKLSDAAAEPAYAECDRGVKARLGRDWRDFRLNVVVHLPTAAAWTGGARWVRCDAVIPRDLARLDDHDLIEREGPLTGPALEALALGCFAYRSAPGASLTGVECAQPHNAEYVGADFMPAGTKYPDVDSDWDKLHEKCFVLAAAFVGVTRSALTTGVSSWIENESRWQGGDRSIRCYLWLDEKTMSASAKGSRGLGIPS